MQLNGETAHKVVLVGPRTLATHLLEHRPREWHAADWRRADGQGKPSEPPMDWASFSQPLVLGGQPHRFFFFGHGIAGSDFERLGPQTKQAMFKRADHIVLIGDASSSPHDTAPALEHVTPFCKVSAVGLGGFSGEAFQVGEHALPVSRLDDAQIAPWLESLATQMAASCGPGSVISSIVEVNCSRFHFSTLTERWEISLSPIWEQGPDGGTIRRLFLAPKSMRQHYFEGPARALLRSGRIAEVVAAVRRHPGPLDELRELYFQPEAPFLELSSEWNPEIGELTLALAHAARCARVGATAEQLIDGGLTPAQSAELAALEHEVIGSTDQAPVEALVAELAEQIPSERVTKPWWNVTL